jgi:hypothetical protein
MRKAKMENQQDQPKIVQNNGKIQSIEMEKYKV